MAKTPLIATVLLGAVGLGYYGDDLLAVATRPAATTVATTTAAANQSSLVGRASVIDGDTIEIHSERIRLNGIDAPEAAQSCADRNGKRYHCGARSADALANLLKRSSPTRCDFVERDQYGRFVGDCYRADGASVQAAMVRSGWALDWPRHSGGAFARDQEAARREKSGMWGGEFEPPWEWRAEQRAQTQQPARSAPLMGSGSSGSCKIKGNISSSGDQIYHVPGQQHYKETKISKNKGERWFCSEAEARAAGWRKARR